MAAKVKFSCKARPMKAGTRGKIRAGDTSFNYGYNARGSGGKKSGKSGGGS